MSAIVFTRVRKPTPGPWRIGKIKNRSDGGADALAVWPEEVVKRRKRAAAICIVSSLEDVTAEDEDTAYLIAAAPDLLAALRAMCNAVYGMDDSIAVEDAVRAIVAIGHPQTAEAYRVARAAIAKAEGTA